MAAATAFPWMAAKAMRPFQSLTLQEKHCQQLAALYNPCLLTTLDALEAAVARLYAPDAWFIDPLVAVSGRSEIADQFWLLRWMFGRAGADAVAVRWMSQLEVLRRGAVTSTATRVPLVAISQDTEPAVSGTAAASPPARRLSRRAGFPAQSGTSSLATSVAGEPQPEDGDSEDTPFSFSAADTTSTAQPEAVRLELVARLPLVACGFETGCAVRLR